MRAYQLVRPAPAGVQALQVIEMQTPEPGPDQIRIGVRACGVCHTDLHIVQGDIHPPSLPLVPGHQVVGRVEALGPAVTRFKLGDRVGIPWLHSACGACPACLRGEENLCPQATFTGFHHHGGYAEQMIARAEHVLPLPTELSDEQLAPLLCAGIIGYRSLRKADLQPGERLGLVGFGASAHLAIQIARHWGCQVYVFTRSVGHRRLAAELGANWVGGVEQPPPAMLDRAVIFAPAGALIPEVLPYIRQGGTLAINAIHMSEIPAMPYRLIYGERSLRSVTNATYADGLELLALAAQIPLQSRTTRYPLEQVNQALIDLKQSAIDGAGVVLP